MSPLDAKQRAGLPDSAFAYIDSHGKRRLPINDAAHVRNALARFNQVVFEDEAARDTARTRLLKAALKHGVAPIGFVRAQLQPQRRFPTGQVTFLLIDLEGSTTLLARLGDRYTSLMAAVRRETRAALRRAGGREVDARGETISSPCSNRLRQLSRLHWQSNGRCTPAPGLKGSMCACESESIAVAPR